ncbi:MAG: hypothetical protein PHU03_02135, partial [Syntrophales bacterium]|nr:hypothetical protein [Syntrophales bacterium]
MIEGRFIIAALIISFLVVVLNPVPSCSSEETVTLFFSRMAPEGQKTMIYRVQKGDSLYKIMRRELSVP